MCDECKFIPADETCLECPVRQGREELCQKCFDKKLLKEKARKAHKALMDKIMGSK